MEDSEAFIKKKPRETRGPPTNYFVILEIIPGELLFSRARFRFISITNVNLFQD